MRKSFFVQWNNSIYPNSFFQSMKQIFTAIALLMVIPISVLAKQEMKDPHPGDQSSWNNVKDAIFGWGSATVRYQKSQPAAGEKKLSLYAWKGERVQAQAFISTPIKVEKATIRLTDFVSGKNIIREDNVRKYYGGYVMAETFNKKDSFLIADRLDDAAVSIEIDQNTTRPVWLDIRIPHDAKPGKYSATLTATLDGKDYKLPVTLQVGKRELPAPKDWHFHLDLWHNPYAVARYFKVPLWSKAHFECMRPLMKELAEAGQKVITCSIIQHPWNSQTYDPFESMITKMKNVDGSWKYDYTVFDRWVEFAMSMGITEQIDCYTLVPWQYSFDYFDLASNSMKYVNCKPNEAAYTEFLLPFLKDFARHLKEKGWLSRTCISMDERPMDQQQAAYNLLQKANPDFKVAGAFDYFPEQVNNIHDISVKYAFKVMEGKALEARRAAGKPVTFYTCCQPLRPNTFTFSPLGESAYMGWYAAATGYDGYLRWAYNSWMKNPTMDSRCSWPSGDCFLTYPEGESMRMKQLVRGFQDYEKIRILKPELKDKQKKQLDNLLSSFLTTKIEENTDVAKMVEEAEKLLRTFE